VVSENEVAAPTADNLLLVATLGRLLPEILWRGDWLEYRRRFGVPYSSRTLANRASLQTGPPVHYCGRRCFYLKSEFLNWLRTIPEYRASVE